MSEQRLDQLFEKARTEPLETSPKDVSTWLSGAVVGLGAAALLPKLKLLIAKKSLIMLSISAGIVTVGAISMGFMQPDNSNETIGAVTTPPKQERVELAEASDAPTLESLEMKPLNQLPQDNGMVLDTTSKRKKKSKNTRSVEPTPPVPPTPPAEPIAPKPPKPPKPPKKSKAPKAPTPPPPPPAPPVEPTPPPPPPVVKHKGDMVTKNVELSDFSKMHITGIYDVFIKQGNSASLTIEAEDEESLERIEANVEDGSLTIETLKKSKKEKKEERSRGKNCQCDDMGHVTLYITVVNLDELKVSGIGDVQSESTLKFDSFLLEVNGVGDVALDVDGKTIEVQMFSAGDVYLKGKAEIADFTFNGVGDLVAEDLELDELNVIANGAGDLIVKVNNKLNATVNGVGDIIYSGNPTNVNINENGVGEIIRD